MRERCGPIIYYATQIGAWAECNCGWQGRTVQRGVTGASVEWSRHMANVAKRRARLRLIATRSKARLARRRQAHKAP
jgi:hypothetical protein